MESTRALYTNHIRTISDDRLYWILQLILNQLNCSWQERRDLPPALARIFQSETDEIQAAEQVSALLSVHQNVIHERLADRASVIMDQIRAHVLGSKILDFACGDGQVSQLLTQAGYNLTLFDIADYRIPEVRGLPFHQEWKDCPAEIDTALAIAAFHHCNDLDIAIERLSHITKRLIVIESVVDDMVMPYDCQAFVDWLYNRGLHPGAAIPVPGNFRTTAAWRETFDRYGFHVTHEEDLGIDLPIVPEHHILFVADRA